MPSILKLRVTWLWLLLIGATIVSWEFGHGLGFGDNYRLSTSAVLISAFIKARMVILDFMEIRHAPGALRFILEAWTVVVAATLLIIYWQSA